VNTRLSWAGIRVDVILAFPFGLGAGGSGTPPGKYQRVAVDDDTRTIAIHMKTRTGAIDACRTSRADISDGEPATLAGPVQAR